MLEVLLSEGYSLSPIILYGVLTLLLAVSLKPVSKALVSYFRRVSALKQFPSLSPRHWLYGTLRLIKNDGPAFLQKQTHWTEKYPRGFVIWVGPFPQLNLVHPETIKPVLKMSDPKHPMYDDALKPWLGEGLLIASGSKWLRSRRLLTPAFHFDVLKPYISIYNQCTEVFMTKLDKLLEKSDSFVLLNNMSLLTLDILMHCAFSRQSDCQTTGEKHPYIQAVYSLGKMMIERNSSFMARVFPWTFKYTAAGRKFAELCDFVHRESEAVISQRQRELVESSGRLLENKKYLDFVDILLTAKDEDGQGMSSEDIRAEVDTFMFEGHDTTASGLSWALYAMAKHPEYQQRVQQEVDSLLEGRDSDEILWEDLPKLKYLSLCLKESLRLYCPVPGIGRTLTHETEIMGVKVPAGTHIGISIWGVHHNKAVWGDDRMEYNPDRFLPDNNKGRDPFAYVPFSAGPRNCIGQNFALNEEKVVLARLLHRYTFEIPDNMTETLPIAMLVLRFSQDFHLVAKPRETSF